MRTTLLLLALILPTAPRDAREWSALCPGCAQYVAEGDCPDCGRPPLSVLTCAVDWYWCSAHRAWHDQSCGRECCALRRSPALRVSENAVATRYCPECRRIGGSEPRGTCRLCGRPMVAAYAATRTWHWCRLHHVWHGAPCAENEGKGCCVATEATLLACVCAPVSWTAREMLVTTDWLNTHLGDPDLVILHVETPGGPAYADGHIPEARYLRWEEIAVERDRVQNEFPPMELLVATIRRLGIHGHERIVLYDTGCGLEAARAYVALELLGLGENASLLDGHWAVWRSEEREISVWEPEVVPSRFSPRPRTDVVVALEEMKGIVWFARRGEGVALLDARPGEEFSGGKAGEGVTRPGHIPGAASVCWLRNLVSKDRPLLRSREELLDLYDTVGARPGALSVVYGRTGTEACHTYFTLRWLGLDVVLYDGSFVEWSRNWKLPVATGG